MEKDTLETVELHPASYDAWDYIKNLDPLNYCKHIESLSSAAMSGNRNAELCIGTIERLKNKQPVGDRYILGLAWTLKILDESIEE